MYRRYNIEAGVSRFVTSIRKIDSYIYTIIMIMSISGYLVLVHSTLTLE